MNKQELIAKVAEKAGLTKTQAAAALDAAMESVMEALKAGDEVRLVGFGTFMVSHRAARKQKIPGTGEVREIPAMNVPRFKPGKALKEAVNKK